MSGGAGGLADVHPDAWPTAQVAHSRLLAVAGRRVAHVIGKHASVGHPRKAQFGQPVAIIGTVDGNLIVCDRMAYTTAWTPDGLFIGTLLDRPVYGPMPADDVHKVGLSGDDWMSGGSIADLGKGEGLWFALSGDRSMAFRVPGFREFERQDGKIELKSAAKAASFNSNSFEAQYFAKHRYSRAIRPSPASIRGSGSPTARLVARSWPLGPKMARARRSRQENRSASAGRAR